MRIGDVVGQYKVTHLLGTGGMGEVYKATDMMIEREVAIKVLRPEIARQPNLLQRFRAEAVTLAKLNHSGIATLYTFLQNGEDFFMVLEYVPGKTLEAVERERGAMNYKVALPLFAKILEAMQPAHEMGILHRDVKPANIMLTTWGTVKLMDFGIARVLGAARQTRQGALVGTMEYIAPERVKGKEGDARGDIYSLGIVLYEMLSGRLPFVSENEFEMMRMHLEMEAPTFKQMGLDVPPEVEAVVRRSIAKNEDDRFSSCEEFLEAIQAAAGKLAITRKQIIELVGQLTISELGTAGHSVSSSAETFTSPPTNAPGTQPYGQSVPTSTAPAAYNAAPAKAPFDLMAFVMQYKIPIGVVAALLAIGGGIGAGLMSRKAAPAQQGTVVTEQQQSTPPPPVNTAGQQPQPRVDSPPLNIPEPRQSQTVGPPQQVIIPSTTVDTTPKPAPKHHSDLRERSIKALEQ